ncbi:HAD family hydrolase [Paenibacillus lemnae]|uniref:HAD hydrolase-like protein n=1 Tax=Paenibacillus lemnae TaxID=1330551 RepID=A0A848MC57_PAELE|nr:HAD hydrolase-like protein [Paenibacillus lemnae]NMO97024.1 HAD hydrolase-like protein [Paenibacillus lemnae]
MSTFTKGIIFDMDNTLLKSSIDFDSMKRETYRFCIDQGLLPAGMELEQHTTSTFIEQAKRSHRMTAELLKALWDIPKAFEVEGMKDADLEPGVTELLHHLMDRYHLVVVTNNAVEAAEAALKRHDILKVFEHVVGRELVSALKPSPDAFLHVLQLYEHVSVDDWISVGGSWIDGKASHSAGIRFVSYQADLVKMNAMGVIPDGTIQHISELKLLLERNEVAPLSD